MANTEDFMLTDSMTLDQIPELPSFECWPTGIYKVALSEGIIKETVNGKPAFIAPLTLLEIIEIVDDEAVGDEPKPGSEIRLMFLRDNKYGARNYGDFAMALGKAIGTSVVSEINEQCKGYELAIQLRKQVDKKDKTKFYPRIVDVVVL